LADELGSVIMDDSSRHVEAVYYMMLENLITSDVFTSFRRIASAHLKK